MRTKPAALAFALALAACDAADPLDAGSLEQGILDGTPDAVGLLALLNDPATTLERLDIDAKLDARAARNLIAHRDGADGRFGTADDNRFDSVDEVDGVAYVGEKTLAALVAYAAAQGLVPSGDDHLGTFDGVPFTVAEAEAVLAVVDGADAATLREAVGLDPRAVKSILEARPVQTMPRLAALYYVGPSMLTRLKTYAAAPPPAESPPPDAPRPDCRVHADCPTGHRCTGHAHDGSTEFGKCYPLGSPPGVDSRCSLEEPCGTGLVCLGEYAYSPGDAFCVEAWKRDTFVNAESHVIPADGSTVATSVVVYGLATVPVDIVLWPEITHDNPQALRIVLRSQTGDEAVMWDGPNTSGPMPAKLVAGCCIPGDDYVNGRWWLFVENVGGAGSGRLDGYKLQITSQWD